MSNGERTREDAVVLQEFATLWRLALAEEALAEIIGYGPDGSPYLVVWNGMHQEMIPRARRAVKRWMKAKEGGGDKA